MRIDQEIVVGDKVTFRQSDTSHGRVPPCTVVEIFTPPKRAKVRHVNGTTRTIEYDKLELVL